MPASPTSSDRPERRSPRLPLVPRPRASLLDPIREEGISWEGQVLIVGNDGDIPALLYVTTDRFLLTNRDTILLEAPRTWLIPAPLRVHESDVRISITPEGVVPGHGTTERLLLTVRDGRGPASQLVAILTGRARKEQINAEFPTWKEGVGAGRSSSLPPLPAFEASQDAPKPKETAGADPEIRGAAPIEPWGERNERRPRVPFQAPDPEPVEPQSHAARFLSTRSMLPEPAPMPEPKPRREKPRPQNVTSITEERRKRRAGWGIWTTRIAMVVIIALVAGWFARPYLPDEITDRLPAAIVDDNGDVALNTIDAPGDGATNTAGDGTNGAGTSAEAIMPTAAALGVGGATTEIPDPKEGGEPSGPEGVLPTPTPADAGEMPGGDTGDQPVADTGTTDTSQPQAAAANTEPDTSGQQSQETSQQVAEPTQPASSGTGDTASDTTGDTAAPQQTEPTVEVPAEIPATETPQIVVPTEEPVVDTPEPTEVPTEAPVIETVAPTTEPTVEQTEIPATATVAPTDAPATGTAEPTVAVEPTQAAETPAPTDAPTLEPQAPSVTEAQPATQQFVDQGIRYSVEGASTGTSLPELPQVAEISYGEWIVLAVDGQNWTDSEQVFDMREFSLIADGEEIQLDVGNSWVASMLGYTPAYGNTDAILWAPGEEHSFALTFLAPRDAQSLILKAGDQQLDLTGLLDETPSLGEMRQAQSPDTIDAKVVDVVDGETIVIEKDGVQQTVRYLGVDAPTGDECYAAEAADANRALVEGKTVKIERQSTNTDAQGNWVRDVWVAQDDGKYVLVAHQLVQEGAVTASISEPNTRFASWLRSAESAAKAESRGLWGSCQQGQGDTAEPPLTQVVAPARQTGI